MSFIGNSSDSLLRSANKPKYFHKYKKIFKDLFDNNNLFSNQSYGSNNLEYSNINLLTSSFDKFNDLKNKVSYTKYNILTGTDLNNYNKIKKENEKLNDKNNNDNSSNYNYNIMNNLRSERNKNRNVLKNFNFYLKNQGTIPSYNLLKKNEKRYISPRNNYSNNNLFIERLHKKFPEYINMKTKGQSFLLQSNQLNSKKSFFELKNKIEKL